MIHAKFIFQLFSAESHLTIHDVTIYFRNSIDSFNYNKNLVTNLIILKYFIADSLFLLKFH